MCLGLGREIHSDRKHRLLLQVYPSKRMELALLGERVVFAGGVYVPRASVAGRFHNLI